MPKTSPNLNMLPKNRRQLLICICGFSLALFGICFGLSFQTIYRVIFEKIMVLAPNSKYVEIWRKPPMKLTLDMYIYNWTNPQDFQNLSIKPILQELGPYRFIEKPEKVDLKWHPENASVTYRKKSTYFFDAAGSTGSLDDKIITISTLAVALSNKAYQWNYGLRTLANLALRNYRDGYVLKRTVREMLFDGYDDLLMNLANIIPTSITDVFVPYDRFGYCYPRNGSKTYNGVFNVDTGARDIRKIGSINTWNFKNYTTRKCIKVEGSTGEYQSPYLRENEPITYFLPDFCRPVKMDYDKPVEFDGVTGFKYIAGPNAVDNGTLNPENVCYCTGKCPPIGLINITACQYDTPLFVSYPHFYQGDPALGDEFEGINPQKEKHESYIILEPKTGGFLYMDGSFQINILVSPMNSLSMFRNKRTIYFPLFWFRQVSHTDPDVMDSLRNLPYLLISGQLFFVLCAIAGLSLILWQPLMKYFERRMLLQQIRINDLMDEQEVEGKHKELKDIGIVGMTPPEISPLLKRLSLSENLRGPLPKSTSMESSKTSATETSSISGDSGNSGDSDAS